MNEKNSKIQIYIAGGLIGAALGVTAPIYWINLLNSKAKESGLPQKVSKTALGVISLLWSLIEKGR
jgi:hypothetical protein